MTRQACCRPRQMVVKVHAGVAAQQQHQQPLRHGSGSKSSTVHQVPPEVEEVLFTEAEVEQRVWELAR